MTDTMVNGDGSDGNLSLGLLNNFNVLNLILSPLASHSCVYCSFRISVFHPIPPCSPLPKELEDDRPEPK